MTKKLCPTCKKEAVEKYMPFCSLRCANVDLGHWFNESYAIPVEEETSDKGSVTAENELPKEGEDL